MIGQTFAIFHDAYRELNAKKMFWVVLFLSALVVLVFLAVGINEKGLKILWWEIESPFNTTIIPESFFYKSMFSALGVGFWLTWIATVLAIISTSGIFPDFISGGSIDLYLSKPISRPRLFLTKYAAGLLFVTLQVLVFSAASFLVIGIRGGTWIPSLFIAVPVVVTFFSYLFAVSVLIGVVTRSTIAALLLTILFWVGVFGVHAMEVFFLRERIAGQQRVERLDRGIAAAERELRQVDADLQAGTLSAEDAERRKKNAGVAVEELRGRRAESGNLIRNLHRVSYGVKVVLPKTSETVALLDRWMVKPAELPPPAPPEDRGADLFGRPHDQVSVDEEVQRIVTARSLGWVLGTSLAFEATVVGLAAWIFCRRDY